MKLRPLRSTDTKACYDVFYRAVHEGAGSHYTRKQQAAWAPSPHAPETWAPRLTNHYTVVATRWGKIVGFFTMGRDGHIDFAYVAPNEMGKGTAGKLYDLCETQAHDWGLTTLETEASHLARRFFEKRDWHTVARQVVIKNSVGIENFRMKKTL